jgi:hypothetical protein
MESASVLEIKASQSSEFVDLTGDGGVLKQILVENPNGDGPPNVAATVRGKLYCELEILSFCLYLHSVHYIGRFLDGSEFDNSYKRKVPLTFRLGQGIKFYLFVWD